MQPTQPNNRTIIFIAAGGIILLIVVVIAVLSLTPKKASPSTTPTPSVSGTPAPDQSAKGPLAPTFYGFDALLDRGISSDQVDALKFALTKYAKAQPQATTKIELVGGSLVIAPRDPNLDYNTASFNVRFNDGQTSYPAQLRTFDLTTSHLYLSNPQNTQVIFDSGDIDLYQGIGD